MPWIERELALALARPRLVITLGAEIAGIIRGVPGDARRNALLGREIVPVLLGSTRVPTVHLAHPGIVMRKGDSARNPWPERHVKEHIPVLKCGFRPIVNAKIGAS
jgi:hypothetical protein